MHTRICTLQGTHSFIMSAYDLKGMYHQRWVRWTHWIVTISFLALVFSGVEILMVHPRLFWGEVGNYLTPALFELPISRNYHHNGWAEKTAFFPNQSSPVSASRTYDIFNQNGWGRSLHFLAGWVLVITGVIYLLAGIFTGHVRTHLWPGRNQFTLRFLYRDAVYHFQMEILSATNNREYGLLQRCTYLLVVILLLPLIALTGLTMSPAITAAHPFLLKIFLGAQSARTIHFFAFVVLILFLLLHIVMVIKSGFKQQIRVMTLGK